MANNILIKDGNGNQRTVKTFENGDVHTPVHHAEGPLTNVELRASEIKVTGPGGGSLPVSGPLTDAQLRNTPVEVTHPEGGSLAVTGPLTDAQLRATFPIPVSIPAGTTIVSDTALRVPISFGYFSVLAFGQIVAPEVAGRTITVPESGELHCSGVRIRGNVDGVLFGLDGPPGGVSPHNQLRAGGIVHLNETREIFWRPGTVQKLYLTVTGDDQGEVWVEFLKSL